MLIRILVVLFLLLIVYQIFLAIFGNLKEGLDNPEYKEYDTKGPGGANILAEQNAGNIAYLKQRIDELMSLKTSVNEATSNIAQLQTQVQGLAQAQSTKATAALNGQDQPVNVSGTEPNYN
jgi:preprotein translocase subunit SecF